MVLNDKKLNVPSTRYQEPVKDILPYYTIPIQHHIEVLASAIRKGNNRITGIQIGKEGIKLDAVDISR